jgi:hypothetical protein
VCAFLCCTIRRSNLPYHTATLAIVHLAYYKSSKQNPNTYTAVGIYVLTGLSECVCATRLHSHNKGIRLIGVGNYASGKRLKTIAISPPEAPCQDVLL